MLAGWGQQLVRLQENADCRLLQAGCVCVCVVCENGGLVVERFVSQH